MPEATLTFDEAVRALERLGTTRARAEQLVRQSMGFARAAPKASTVPAPAPKSPIAWPVRLTLPWSVLVSDNRKYGVIDGRMLVTVAYRAAGEKIAALARHVVGDVEPVRIPLAISARVWVPDNRVHDVCNFAKCVHDALEDVIYHKDQWLHRTTWERAGVDVDAPRAEITIMPHAGAE